MIFASCKEARGKGERRYFTGKPCKNGHIAFRNIHKACLECSKIESRERWRKKQIGKIYITKERITKPARYYLKLVLAAKYRSQRNNIAFDLTHEWADKRWTGCCELTGIPFLLPKIHGKKHAVYHSATIDKIDPTQGYLQNNCRFILYALNTFKGQMSDDEMFKIAIALVSNSNAGLSRQ